ncbi:MULTISPECIES: siderophore-interacting protein [unclassified Oceanobacter]|uniref:siderophore-interacting protein n=1 Tax=unclassified Oceanobacter TaxID=2620260 RepID=UPI0027346AB6|nr:MULTISPECIES: siderophore-interacting protein [unclassified Oceanobacter]MDP2608654.1 siderophore-interacting protein [Oceanobacter sp. 1_MG-2023]MDP2611750.1 siderophore-interacting protein [Oceanobacter sp. 2_MG-2023]
MSRPSPRELVVHSSSRLTTNMQRLVFSGDALADFPVDSASGYIKLMFTADGQPLTPATALEGQRPLMRTYTVRAFDPDKFQLTVDCALHNHGPQPAGPAASWAARAQPGERILVGGPGPTKLIDNSADWYFLAGDMTALPAISCNLEQLPAEARGYAVIEIASAEDRQSLECPAGVEVIWVVDETSPELAQAESMATSSALLQRVVAAEWLSGRVAVWVACEFHKMKALRRYFRQQRQTGRKETYISSYWKLGRSEDEHKVDKRADQALVDAAGTTP